MKRKLGDFLFFMMVLILSFEGKAQSLVNVDSLKSVLKNTEGKARVETLNLLATNLRESEQESAFNYALEAEGLAHSIGDISGESLAKENIGWIYYRRGQYQKSFDFSKDAYELALQVDNMKVAARLLNSMGALYYEQQNFDLAIEQFKKAYLLSKREGDLYTQIRSLNNVAYNFSQKNELDSALYYAKYAIEVNRKAGSPYLTAFANRVIGDIYYTTGNYDSAASIFENSLNEARLQHVKTTEASVTHRLGATYLKLGKLSDAEKVLLEGVQVSEENKFLDELAKNHKYLAQVYEEKGDIRNAYQHQSTYVVLNDSLVDKGNRDRIALLQGMFQEDLDKSELNLLKEQNENQAQRLKLIRRNYYIIAIAIVLILGLLIWLFLLNRNIKKYNDFLLEQKRKIKDQNIDLEAKSLQLEKINETKNKLFSILGHDLKAPIGQVKSVVDLLIQGMLTKEEFEELLKVLNKDINSVHFTLNNTLKWSMAQMEGFKLKKMPFSLYDLVASNLTLIEPQLKEKEIVVSNLMQKDQLVYADQDLMEVVVRNILNNAVKFSKRNGTVEITTSPKGQFVKWCVQDHGIGIKASQIKEILGKDYIITDSQKGTEQEKGSGLGLQLCKEFVRMNGGEIYIQSKEGEGTRICLDIPQGDLIQDSNTSAKKEISQA